MIQRPTIDREAFEAAISERDRNVVIDAGAGTGKTTALIRRFINLVAPNSSNRESIPIARLAAITFTRRAAGELQFRLRQVLLQELSKKALSQKRERQLYEALSSIDSAYIGTIHSFCDRLMRLRPVEMNLSPSYEILEDPAELVAETVESLVRAAQTGTLSQFVKDPSRAKEAEKTVCDFLVAGLRLRSYEGEFQTWNGLDSLVEGFINHRDIPPREFEIGPPDLKKTERLAREIIRKIESLSGDSKGHRLFRSLLEPLQGLLELSDPGEALETMVQLTDIKPKTLTKGADCNGDDRVFRLAKDYGRAKTDRQSPEISYQDQLTRPFFQWMAARLVRLSPVATQIYESVKGRHQAVDHLDLLLQFRNRIRENKELRGFYQGLFDHILVDEFQDTDPLQMEIMFFLAEAAPARARTWEEVMLSPGRLTIVGDPKQSIYRFRRADIRSYDRARRLLGQQGALEVSLVANFRSRPQLINAFNRRFKEILGEHLPGTSSVNEISGKSLYDPLAPSGVIQETSTPCVRGLPYTGFEKKPDGMLVEAEMLARYVRWMVHSKKGKVRDPTSDEEREVRFEDVTVLARSTSYVPLLLEAFRRYNVPYSARGGRLFLLEPLVRRFILGLRAIADPQDGVAQAALFRPPFFAVDYADLLVAECDEDALKGAREEVKEAAARAQSAREFVRDLRRHRYSRPPSATALDLLERSGFGRSVALMPNGALTLGMMREIIMEMDLMAEKRSFDFDGVTQEIRKWVDDPVQMDPPDPVDVSAVRVLSIHQAKGLEFPVVIIWDGFDSISAARDLPRAWYVSHDGESWGIDLDPIKVSLPPGSTAFDQEKSYAAEERKRLYYVAATRARDMLILPLPDNPRGVPATSQLAEGLPADLLHMERMYSRALLPAWANGISPAPSIREIATSGEFDTAIEQSQRKWNEALKASSRPIAEPLAVTRAIYEGAPVREEDDHQADREVASREKSREGRYGSEFGQLVHEVLAAVVSGSITGVKQLIHAAAAQIPGCNHLDEAMGDIERAVLSLRKTGVLGDGFQTESEYPVVMADGKGHLLVGFVDLVALSSKEVWIIDYKTNSVSADLTTSPFPEYIQQLRTYARMLNAAGVIGTRQVRQGLLFTATGQILEV
ncbi:MAG: UvrD-helicase domain-containing protein [Acidobacteriia bacterium]|nr:UvrD-helicase domain-containing protein [Terriglobia bacterium]